VDAKERFSVAADDYHRSRPGYPAALFDWIDGETGLPRAAWVADVGCGTGVSTRPWASRGHWAVGLDPNAAMLAQAARAGGALYLRADAAAAGLRSASIDLVTVAQALHWLDFAAVLPEFRRILRPGGCLAAFWNLRAGGGLMDEYDAVIRTFSTEYAKVPRAKGAVEALRRAPEVLELREAEFPNEQLLDEAGLLGRAHSSSYVAHGVADRAGFDRALGELFARHQAGAPCSSLPDDLPGALGLFGHPLAPSAIPSWPPVQAHDRVALGIGRESGQGDQRVLAREDGAERRSPRPGQATAHARGRRGPSSRWRPWR
jgi:ubiquinone/menaquinone biosynthesis C-methylase UbiE